MAKDIKFNIKLLVDGKEQVVTTTTNVRDLRRALQESHTFSQKLGESFLRWNQASQVLNSLSSNLQSLNNITQQYTQAFAVQEQNEQRLAEVMRERMNATDEQVQKMKDLAAEQQQLGVVGDEVQLAGMQQVATFLQQTRSIEVLLPAMNNLLVQQKGLNATAQDAQNIANMLGKAMMGQTTALRRAGITFSEAQAEMMKHGDESERAALLAEIITQNVGNMNAELAKTDSGKIQQTKNAIGDLNEKIGQALMPYQALISQAAQLGMVLFSAIQVISLTGAGIKNLTLAIAALTKTTTIQKVATAASTTAMSLWQRVSVTTTAMTRTLSAGFNGVAVSATTAKVAMGGFIALGVVAAVGAMVAVIASLTGGFNKAKVATEELTAADDAYKRKYSEVKVALDEEVRKLDELMRAKQDTSAAVQHLNEVYGQSFGYYQKAAEWYEVLTAKSKQYATQLALEAKTQSLRNAIAENDAKKEIALQKQKELVAKRDWHYTPGDGGGAIAGVKPEETMAYRSLTAEINELSGKNVSLYKELGTTIKALDKVSGEIAKSRKPGTKVEKTIGQMNLSEVNARLTENKAKGETLTDPMSLSILRNENAELKKRKSYLEGLQGLGSGAGAGAVGKSASVRAPKASKATIAKDAAVEGSIAWYEEQLNALRKRISSTADESTAKALQIEYNRLESAQKALKVRIGIDKEEVQKEVEKIDLTIPAETTPTSIAKGSAEDKRQSYSNAEQMAARIQSDLDIGLIGADEAKRQIQEINALLASLGLKPITIELETRDIELAEKRSESAAQAVQQMGSAIAGLGSAIEVPALNIMGTLAQAIATMVLGYAEATKMAATLGPWAWLGFGATGLAQLTAMISAVKNVGTFADGGIAYGPTLGIFGEYAGASHNPEVVAPLNQLRNLIRPESGIGGRVEFDIKGRKLVGLLKKENRLASRR